MRPARPAHYLVPRFVLSAPPGQLANAQSHWTQYHAPSRNALTTRSNARLGHGPQSGTFATLFATLILWSWLHAAVPGLAKTDFQIEQSAGHFEFANPPTPVLGPHISRLRCRVRSRSSG